MHTRLLLDFYFVLAFHWNRHHFHHLRTGCEVISVDMRIWPYYKTGWWMGAPKCTLQVGGHSHINYNLLTYVQASYKFIVYLRN